MPPKHPDHPRAVGPRARSRHGDSAPRRAPATPGREWLGGVLSPPFYITEDEPRRVETILWLELPDDYIVGLTIVDPASPLSFAQSFLDTCEHPAVGEPRRPDRVRVADATLAAELRATVGPPLEVVVAPTPELDAVVERMAREIPGDERRDSYFENARVSEGAVRRMFEAARYLYAIAPWKQADDDQVLRLDIPALGLSAACVSIIGALGQNFGIIIFPSYDGHEAFIARAEQGPPVGPVDFGTTMLSLTFERAEDLPPAMRREALKHGWPVAAPTAYPTVEHRDRDGALRPLTERDVRIATACASALATFCMRYPAALKERKPVPASDSYEEGDVVARLTAPFEAYDLFEEKPEAPPSGRRAPEAPALASSGGPPPDLSRNAPCWCGSGRKYKRCHLVQDRARQAATAGPAAGEAFVTGAGTDPARASGGAASRPSSAHARDERLTSAMTTWAAGRYRREFLTAAADFRDAPGTSQISIPWLLYHFPVQGGTIAERYLHERARYLSREDQDWLAAQAAAWLSVWEVQAVEPGASLTLRDQLSGEQRQVREVSASRTLGRRDTVLARIADHAGESLLVGLHPRALGPIEADAVVHGVRTRLRHRAKSPVPVERLRDAEIGRHLIARWETAVEELDARLARAPELHNTDGEEFVLTTDHFAFDAPRRDEVAARLAALEGVRRPEPDGAYEFVREGGGKGMLPGDTIIGTAVLSREGLRVETNSTARADLLRARIERGCGGLVRHRAREQADPFAAADVGGGGATRARARRGAEARRPPSGLTPLEPPTPELAAALQEIKRSFYAKWLDEPIPLLGGKTPREAARTARGRERVDALLKDIESRELRLTPDSPLDLRPLRRELGLED